MDKRRVHAGDNALRLIVTGEPDSAGIDPLGKLIDRDASDNVVPVSR
jgi:hypothetical protein